MAEEKTEIFDGMLKILREECNKSFLVEYADQNRYPLLVLHLDDHVSSNPDRLREFESKLREIMLRVDPKHNKIDTLVLLRCDKFYFVDSSIVEPITLICSSGSMTNERVAELKNEINALSINKGRKLIDAVFINDAQVQELAGDKKTITSTNSKSMVEI